ncbi:hypothetical protein K1T71_003299 [Dendrolimus kikuchii]|uniref:Uncharacterized protein n=1 Tax=Dendrolimus kikuchii TaxID=765133 RepID=A0ACC1DBA3_9NEOP|nr:hypothetical protein K1T71_003299 [Dendrolimus kikuchii]
MQPELLVEPRVYNGSFPRFDRPKIMGCIGLENLKFAKRICDDKVNFDLNLRLNDAIFKPQTLDVKITELLKFLSECEPTLKFNAESKLSRAKFYCYRGLMTLVACTPYENRESWKIVAILHKGNIYLCARDTEEQLHRKKHMTEEEKKFTSWGYKFEQFMLSDRPDIEPNPNLPVNENEEFSLVFKTNLNKHTIIYGAEMDGLRCDKAPVPLPPSGTDAIINYLSDKQFIELKTNRHIEFPKQETSFRRFKCKKWWCQSFLAGVDTILCGFRNDNGIVEELKVFSVAELPKRAQRLWDPNVCFNFLDTFLTYVKRCIERKIRVMHGNEALDNLLQVPLMSLLFEWAPGGAVYVNECYNYDDDPILPQWFIDSYGNTAKDGLFES